MFTDGRKIKLLQRLLKTTNEATLLEIETILGKSKKNSTSVKKKKPSIHDFVGIFKENEAKAIRIAIDRKNDIDISWEDAKKQLRKAGKL